MATAQGGLWRGRGPVLWLPLVLGVCCGLLPLVRSSHLALLSGTLRTFQKHACDEDLLTLKCPLGTEISVQLAQYGRQAPSYLLCPPPATDDDHLYSPDNETTNCLATSSLQYYLLQTVVEHCQGKKTCRVPTSPQTFGTDPCPGTRKYVEVAFKCRPTEFRANVVCEGEVIHLKCHPASRIAIYSANFGRTLHGSLECPQPEGVPEEDCQASYATETVMRICHGRRKCSMTADDERFGKPCEEVTRKYLKIVYTCVPKRVLKDRYQGGVDSEDADQDSHEEDVELVEEPSYDPSSSPEVYGPSMRPVAKPTKDLKKKPEPTWPSPSHGAALTPTSRGANEEPPAGGEDGDIPDKEDGGPFDAAQPNCTEPVSPLHSDTDRVLGFITEWIGAYNFVRANSEKLILYLTLSFTVGLIALLAVIIGRLLMARRKERRSAKLNISEPLPDSFGDDLSDIDQDIADLTRHGRDEASVEVVRYTSRSTMRRTDSDTNPRAPINRSHNNYYYS